MRTLIAYALLVLVVASVAVQAQAPAGGEFRVNNATAVGDITPSIAADASGAFVVAWIDGSVAAPVKARRFDPQGVPRGGMFTVASASGYSSLHSVASDERGRTMMVWTGIASGLDKTIRGRVFNPSGAPMGAEFVINHVPGNAYDPAVAAEQGGNFVVVWEGGYGDGSGSLIMVRRFDLAGNALGPQVRVNSYTTNDQAQPSVASVQSGGFVVVWTSAGADGSLSGVFGRRFNVGGVAVGLDFQVNAYTTGWQFDPQVVTDAQGGFVVVWQDLQGYPFPPSIIGRRFDASGAPLGPEFLVGGFATANTSYSLSAASDRTGNFTVLWEAPDGSARGVVGRRFASSGAPRGPQFRVNTSTTSDQRFPDLASDGAGNLFATWQSGQSGTTVEIYGRRFGGLVPAGLSVDDSAGNGVLEAGDTFTLRTSWRNVTGIIQSFQGSASGFQLPPGLTGTLSAATDYTDVYDGQVSTCTPCFAGSVTGTRPAGHVDGSFLETIVPDAQGQTRRRLLHIGESFSDVPRTSPFYRFVETMLHHGVSGGCDAGLFCPTSSTPREQIAVMGLLGKEGAGYQPPACGIPRFLDVPASSPFCRWIEELARRGIVNGCGGGNYCPSEPVTREQLCVIILLLLDPTANPVPCGTPVFGDVPASSPFCRWIEELARRGVVAGCGGGDFCPTLPVTREQVSVFIGAAFGLTLYGP